MVHDEAGQSLTAVLLQLERSAGHVPPGPSGELRRVREATRAGPEEILELVAGGHASQQIAHLLVISPGTVERRRTSPPATPGPKDRLELTRYAIRVRPIEP